MGNLFIKKDIYLLTKEADENDIDDEKSLKRTLTAGNLIALGIGAIIGAGLL